MKSKQTTTNVDILRKLYAAFAAGDIEAVIQSMRSDIVWREAENFIYADGNPYIGPDAILGGLFARLGSEWENFRLEEKQFFNVEEDRALVTGRYRATHATTGKDLDAQFAHFWTLKDGLVVSFQQYTDTKQAAEVVTSDVVAN